MSHEVVQPAPVRPGDRVAVLSPAWCAPEHFPAVHEQALRKIRDDLGLEPVEYPTTRRQGTPAERAADLNAALADPGIRAVMATIGGEDQITVLPHLDPELPRRDPKPFLGYSDNTNVLNWLWVNGVAGVHGGSTQVHLGPEPRIAEPHLRSLRAALFGGDVELTPLRRTADIGIPWDDPRVLTDEAPSEPAEPWTWTGSSTSVTAPTWGGNLEMLQWILGVGRDVLPVEAYDGHVLVLETSEDRPPAREVYWMLRVLGERGILGGAAALVWARPPAGDLTVHPTQEEARALREANRESVLRAVEEYAPGIPVVLDVDLGHTNPQYLVPYGGRMTVDVGARRLVAHFDRD